MALEVALTVGTISILTRQNKNMIKQEDSIAVVVQHTEQISITTAKIDKKIDVLTQLQKDNPYLENISLELAGLRDQMSVLAQRSVGQPAMQNFIEDSQASVQNTIKPIAAEIAAVQGSCTTAGEMELARELVEGTGIEPINIQVVSGSTQRETLCPTCGRAVTSREVYAANEHFGNNITEAKGHSNTQLRTSLGDVAKLRGQSMSTQQLEDESIKHRQQRPTFTSLQKEYPRESLAYQTFLSNTLRSGKSPLVELTRKRDAHGELYCSAWSSESHQGAKCLASLSEDMPSLPEIISEHCQERQRYTIPIAQFQIKLYDHHRFLELEWWSGFYQPGTTAFTVTPFWVPTTNEQVYNLLTKFYVNRLYLEKGVSTVADSIAGLRFLCPNSLWHEGFKYFLQIGLHRLAGTEKIKDVEAEGTILWLMGKPRNLPDEVIMIQDLKRPMLRVRLSLQEKHMLGDARLRPSSKVLENCEEQSLEQRAGGFVLPKKVTKQELVAAETNGQLPVAASSVSTGVRGGPREDALRVSAVAMAKKMHGVIYGR
ncbi:hypothetical protein LTR70_006871 [Exophiala xenobiotica]|uniref:Uncharacterized protein n=1 Tax=Lithohypha guttulata TaxID=1690604 RepID=A0ABR0K688_9EURO|nr:hypothetical protein LTR24_006394 [Lithohypha guttulata]KAK5315132.1 hypothetical protein LTR70_006871 [Exophiala xenobiotica]